MTYYAVKVNTVEFGEEAVAAVTSREVVDGVADREVGGVEGVKGRRCDHHRSEWCTRAGGSGEEVVIIPIPVAHAYLWVRCHVHRLLSMIEDLWMNIQIEEFQWRLVGRQEVCRFADRAILEIVVN